MEAVERENWKSEIFIQPFSPSRVHWFELKMMIIRSNASDVWDSGVVCLRNSGLFCSKLNLFSTLYNGYAVFMLFYFVF